MKGLFHDAIMLADTLSEKFMHVCVYVSLFNVILDSYIVQRSNLFAKG